MKMFFARFASTGRCAAIVALLVLSPLSMSAQTKNASSDAASDPILRALKVESCTTKSQLKMDNVDAPFYIEYRGFDVDQFETTAAFGATREQSRSRLRLLRAVVRLGDYKVDSFIEAGQGTSDILPLDNDELAIRHQIWMATDQAYNCWGSPGYQEIHAEAAECRAAQNDFAKAAPA